MPVRAITFDLWLTLIWDSKELEEYRKIRRLVNLYRLANRLGTRDGNNGTKFRLRELRIATDALSAELKMLYEEGHDLTPEKRGKFLLDSLKLKISGENSAKVYEKTGKILSNSGFVSKFPSLNPEAEPTLRALKRKFPKIKIGLISNAARSSATYRRILTRLGVGKYFDEFVISCEVGYLKPRKEIFRHALNLLSVEPEETLHVGDLFPADVVGATSCNMNACLYTGLWHKYAQYMNPGEHISSDFRSGRRGILVEEIHNLRQAVKVAEKIP